MQGLAEKDYGFLPRSVVKLRYHICTTKGLEAMAIQAMFFDVDGTLVSFETHQIPPSTLDCLHRMREKGIKLFLSTGRHPGMLGGVLETFPFDGVVAVTGQVCTMGDQVLRSNPLKRSHLEALFAAKKVLGFPCIFLAHGEMFMSEDCPIIREFWAHLQVPLPPIKPLSYALELPVYQVITFLPPEEEDKLFAMAPELNHTRWCNEFLDVIPESGGKDTGLQAVMDHLGLTREEVMAFGDGENDLSMIRHAGIGVVMGSGTDYLKSQGDYVTGTVDEEGIPNALRHFHLL